MAASDLELWLRLAFDRTGWDRSACSRTIRNRMAGGTRLEAEWTEEKRDPMEYARSRYIVVWRIWGTDSGHFTSIMRFVSTKGPDSIL